MSKCIRGTTAILTLGFVLASCSGPDFVSFPPDPYRMPDRVAPSVVGSSPTLGVVGSPTPAATVPPSVPPAVVESPQALPTQDIGQPSIAGSASTYGGRQYDGLFALPAWLAPRGTRVEICSLATDRCLIRTSNDVGPKKSTGKVADLDAPDFNYLCACDWHGPGVQDVSIEFLDD